MKYVTALSIAFLLVGCGSGNPLDELYRERATAQCRQQGLNEDSPGWDQCFEPAFTKARDVR